MGSTRTHLCLSECQCMQAAGQNCILVTRGEETGQYNIVVCDAIGTPVDLNTTLVEPLCLTMTSTHVVAASADSVFVWQYSPAAGNATACCPLQPYIHLVSCCSL